MQFDWDAGPEASATRRPEQETRCFAVTGSRRMLDALEEVLRLLAERGNLLTAEGKVRVEVLGSWIEEE